MKLIPLTQGKFAKVDDEDFEWLSERKWCAKYYKNTDSFYAEARLKKKEGGGKIYMGREIMKTPRELVCDHINHDTLDYQKENLRNITYSQNLMNRKKLKSNSSGITGVKNNHGRYRATLTVSGFCVLDRTFANMDDAVTCRREAEIKYFGEHRYKPPK